MDEEAYEHYSDYVPVEDVPLRLRALRNVERNRELRAVPDNIAPQPLEPLTAEAPVPQQEVPQPVLHVEAPAPQKPLEALQPAQPIEAPQ